MWGRHSMSWLWAYALLGVKGRRKAKTVKQKYAYQNKGKFIFSTCYVLVVEIHSQVFNVDIFVTLSMFIHFPGRSKDEAFVLGQEIADAVTAMFPKPMKLRFEKVSPATRCV